jgi:hypothetical protein
MLANICWFSAKEADVPRLIDRIRSRAYELARSGQLANFDAVERRLIEEGHAAAHRALADPYVRDHVARLCLGGGRPGVKRTAAEHLVARYLHG